jgi:hypothetical protein
MSSLRPIDFGSFCILTDDQWEDITASLRERNVPFTLAKAERGVGVLQFSPALHKGGPLPQPSLGDLSAMLAEFGERHGMGVPFEGESFYGEVFGAGASFRYGDDAIRVWYLSDGTNIMLVTYTCSWCNRSDELRESERIVRSVRFKVEKGDSRRDSRDMNRL